MQDEYKAFLASKLPADAPSGVQDVPPLSPHLKEFQAAIVAWALRRGRAAIFAGTGLGKALDARWPVATPDGWREIGDLDVGDYVMSPSGHPVMVIGIFPQGERELFRVTFTDDSYTVCDAEHIWSVNSRKRRHNGKPFEQKTLRQIAQEGIKDGSIHKHYIPMCEPVEYQERVLPIDPYFLGVLIGDGHIREDCVSVTTDIEIIEDLSLSDDLKIRIEEHQSPDIATAHFIKRERYSGRVNSLVYNLRRFGLAGCKSSDKFIPDAYMTGSVAQRRALLAGILDTDGSFGKDGNLEWGSVSRTLAFQVADLIRSFGGTARVNTKLAPKYLYDGEVREGQTYYRMSVRLPPRFGCPFRLSRKADSWRPFNKYMPVRAIKSIHPAGSGHAVCIKVDSDNGLFIVKDYVVTHNTLMQLEWARVVAEEFGNVLILCPLAVAEQTVAEAAKFGIEGVSYAQDQKSVTTDIVVTNYERFNKFDLSRFIGIVCDESGILKSHDGKTRQTLTDSCRNVPWRLCCTATPAPNDFTEIGQHSEFLGVMDAKEMLAMFFVHDGSIRANDATQGNDGWRMKRHAAGDFWRWLASWSVMVRHPRDLGFDEPGYDLPPLHLHQVTVAAEYKPTAGSLFPIQASTLAERIGVRRDTADDRIRATADIVMAEPGEPWLIWANLNYEADEIEKAIPQCKQVAGRHDVEVKVSRLLGFKHGDPLILCSKPSLAGHGLNFQNCARMVFIGLTDSFEQVYQAIRRCWRFGQSRPVEVYFVSSELEGHVVANLKRKESAFELMLDAMSEHMTDLMRENVIGGRNATYIRPSNVVMELPRWIG